MQMANLVGFNESLKKSSSNASSLPSLSTGVVDGHSVPAVVDRVVQAARVRVVVVVCVIVGLFVLVVVVVTSDVAAANAKMVN